MLQEHIWNLIAKKLSGEASEDELHDLEDLLKANPELHYPIQHIIDLWRPQAVTDPEETHQAFNRHLRRMQEFRIDFTSKNFYNEEEQRFSNYSPKRSYRRIAIWTTVCILAIVGLAFFGTRVSQRNERQNISVAAVSTSLADKMFSEISTRNGSKTNVLLPDGTKVWLNAGSRLTYDKGYNSALREVTLDGEAFFDVVHNAERPFIIHTAKINIKVLGTRFNVKSYPADKTTEASLIRGSIEVSFKDRPSEKIILKPNEKIVVSNRNDKSQRLELAQDRRQITEPIVAVRNLTYYQHSNDIVETSWVDNRLIFQDESFEDLAKQLERWYGVSISFNSADLKELYFTGSFKNENITQALNALKLSNNFNYVVDDSRNISITK